MKNILTEALVNSATNASFIFSYTNSAKLRLYLTQIADRRFQFRISIYTIGILKGEFTMKDLRNPIERRNFTHPAGNTMTELKEAELNNFAAGAGEPRNSGGMFCTSTGECNMGTLNIFCC